MTELIKITTNDEGKQLVSARELHEGLKIGTAFKDWIKRMIEYGFEEGIDFSIFLGKSNGGRPSKEYIITLDMAKEICRKTRRNINAPMILNYLLSVNNKEVYIIEPERKEIEFGKMLDTITGYNWKRQVNVCNGKYRVDFLLGTNVIVEYDEKYHENNIQLEKDKKREQEIKEYFKNELLFDDYDIPIIRVKEGHEYEGIRNVIDLLIGYEIISNWNNMAYRSDIY